MWVLLVDDDAFVREAVSRMLRIHGHRCTSVASLEHAREVVFWDGVEVVLLDWSFGGGGAMTALEFAQLSPRPVLFFTASPWSVPDDWSVVCKPAENETIVEGLEQVLAGFKVRVMHGG